MCLTEVDIFFNQREAQDCALALRCRSVVFLRTRANANLSYMKQDVSFRLNSQACVKEKITRAATLSTEVRSLPALLLVTYQTCCMHSGPMSRTQSSFQGLYSACRSSLVGLLRPHTRRDDYRRSHEMQLLLAVCSKPSGSTPQHLLRAGTNACFWAFAGSVLSLQS